MLDDPDTVLSSDGDGGAIHPYGTVRALASHSQTFLLCETRESKYAAWWDGTTIAIPGFHPEIDTGMEATTPALNYQTERHPVFLSSERFGGSADMQWGPSSYHPGVTVHSFGDTKTMAIGDDISAVIYKALITRKVQDNSDIPDSFWVD